MWVYKHSYWDEMEMREREREIGSSIVWEVILFYKSKWENIEKEYGGDQNIRERVSDFVL